MIGDAEPDSGLCHRQPFAGLLGREAEAPVIGSIAYQQHGPVYIRLSRPKTSVVYGNDEVFAIGGLKVLLSGASRLDDGISLGGGGRS